MFGGIVETIAYVTRLKIEDGCKHFTFKPCMPLNDLVVGESIAINGVCLTITAFDDATFSVTAVPETLRLTNLDDLDVNHAVNLERSLKLSSRVHGHYVQGHVDGIGEVTAITPDHSTALLVTIQMPSHLAKYIVNKGYIALDGMSITIIKSTHDNFTVTFIPHTQAVTTVHEYKVGRKINIEVDIMGKYVEKILEGFSNDRPN